MSDDDRYPDTESDADKRAYHNLLERKRRDHIKDSFTSLRDVLPAFKGEKVRASRAQILKKAADFIQTTRRRNLAHRADIEDLKRENILLEDQIRILQNAVETGNLEEAGPIIASRVTTSNPRFSPPSSSSDSDSDLDDDSTDSDDSSKDRRKRLKVSHKSVKRS